MESTLLPSSTGVLGSRVLCPQYTSSSRNVSSDGLRNYSCRMSLLSRIIFMTSSSTLFCEFLFWRHSYVLIIFVATTICSTALKYICVPVGGESLEAWIPDLSPSNPSSPRARTSCEHSELLTPILMVISSVRKWNHEKISICSLKGGISWQIFL